MLNLPKDFDTLLKIDGWDDCENPINGHKGNCIHIYRYENYAIKAVFKDRENGLLHRDNLIQEANALKDLIHDNIIKSYGYFENDNMAWLVLDYIEDNLAGLKKLLNNEQKDKIYIEIKSAIKFIFEKGYCHLDINPNNVMITKTFSPILIDFQVAKKINQTDTSFENSIDYVQRIKVESCCGAFLSWSLIDFKKELYGY
jgi:serine/threonine protein kinase